MGNDFHLSAQYNTLVAPISRSQPVSFRPPVPINSSRGTINNNRGTSRFRGMNENNFNFLKTK